MDFHENGVYSIFVRRSATLVYLAHVQQARIVGLFCFF